MPDQESYAAQLYLNRCGQCHQAYNPSLMTAPMWAVKVDLMQERMKQTGLTPLTPHERETILEYLSSRVARWWLPDEIRFIDEVPKTSVGKFDKKVLRAQHSAEHTPSV